MGRRLHETEDYLVTTIWHNSLRIAQSGHRAAALSSAPCRAGAGAGPGAWRGAGRPRARPWARGRTKLWAGAGPRGRARGRTGARARGRAGLGAGAGAGWRTERRPGGGGGRGTGLGVVSGGAGLRSVSFGAGLGAVTVIGAGGGGGGRLGASGTRARGRSARRVHGGCPRGLAPRHDGGPPGRGDLELHSRGVAWHAVGEVVAHGGSERVAEVHTVGACGHGRRRGGEGASVGGQQCQAPLREGYPHSDGGARAQGG